MTRALALAFVAVTVLGCGPPPPRHPGDLVAPAQYGPDVMLRQRITILRDGNEHTLDCVLQKRGDTLTLLALTPFGTRAFAIEQRGTGIRVRSFTSSPPPFPPRWILLDVQRALAPAIRPGPLPDGTHRADRGPEHITERWQSGRLLERRFARDDIEGEIRIRYRGSRIDYDNPWARHTLRIETLERTPL